MHFPSNIALVATLSTLLVSTSANPIPSPVQPGSFRISTRMTPGQLRSYRLANGTIDLNWVHTEALNVLAKYAQRALIFAEGTVLPVVGSAQPIKAKRQIVVVVGSNGVSLSSVSSQTTTSTKPATSTSKSTSSSSSSSSPSTTPQTTSSSSTIKSSTSSSTSTSSSSFSSSQSTKPSTTSTQLSKVSTSTSTTTSISSSKPSSTPVVSSAFVPASNYYDVLYYGSVAMGSAGQNLPVDLDTGSSDLWLPVIPISGSPGYFNTSASSSYQPSQTTFSIQYGSGSAKGTVAVDRVSFGGLQIANQSFGAVTSSAGFSGLPIAGILGLAFSSIAATRQPTFISNLISRGLLSANLFAIHMTRGGTSGSELDVGALNSAHYSGPISYTPLTSQTYWEVSAGVSVSGSSVNTGMYSAIDTGTTLIYVPSSVASALYAKIPGAVVDSADSSSSATLYQFPCSSTPLVALTFAGVSSSFAINSADFNLGQSSSSTATNRMCVGAVIGMDVNDCYGNPLAIVGDSFICSWYSVFNYNVGGNPAVGFATNV